MPSLDPSLLAIAADALRPTRTSDPLDWYEAHIEDIPTSPKRGRFDRRVWPWIPKALAIMSDHETRKAVLLWGTQLGKSTAESALACYLIANYPGPMMITQDTQPNADDFSQNAFRPLIANCKPVRDLLVPDSDKSDTLRFRNDMVLWIKSANNETNLQRRTLRYIIADECWEYQPNRIDQAIKRVDKFEGLGKVILASQGSEHGDEFYREWEMTDKATWHMRCKSCGLLQPWVWEQIRFPEDARGPTGWDTLRVRSGTTYECAGCHVRIPDTEESRNDCNAGGDFVAQCAPRERGLRGLHVNALAGVSWGKLGVEMIKSAEAFDLYADTEPRKIFKMKRLAQFWSDEGGQMVTDFRASDYTLGSPWDKVAYLSKHGRIVDRAHAGPEAKATQLRTMGVDKQLDHYWVSIRDFAKDSESRLVHCQQVTDGWAGLDALAARFNLHPALVGVDAGWSQQEVIAMCAERGWKATKGFGQDDFAIRPGMRRFYTEPETVVLHGGKVGRMIKFSNLALKDILNGMRLRKLHTFPLDAPKEYVDMMNAEVRVKDKGKPVWVLKQGVKDNHYFDAEVIALLMAVRWGIGGRDISPPSSEAGPFPQGQM